MNFLYFLILRINGKTLLKYLKQAALGVIGTLVLALTMPAVVLSFKLLRDFYGV